jgi:hypothetical protein
MIRRRGGIVAASCAEVKRLALAGAAMIDSPAMRRSLITLALLGISLSAGSCRRHERVSPQRPATIPGAGAVTSIDSEQYGIHLNWPPEWSPRQSKDYVLELVSNDAAGATISLDVPSLPPHLPGMIKMNLVANGFLDDLKKEQPSLQVTEQKDVSMPNTAARRIVTTWRSKDGSEYRQDALLMVHADRVYIIRGAAPMKSADKTRAACEHVVSSLKWLK